MHDRRSLREHVMAVSRTHVIALLLRTGHEDQVARAAAVLPSVVDLDRDEELMRGFNLSQERLMEDLGSSS